MNFDKSRVYTALNADELKVGSKVIVADDLFRLKEDLSDYRLLKIIERVKSENCEHRFLCDDGFTYRLAYLVEEPKELNENAELERQNKKMKSLLKEIYEEYGFCELVKIRNDLPLEVQKLVSIQS